MKKIKSKRTFSWMHLDLEVRETGECGKGIFATADIEKDDLLVIFGGYAMHLSEYFELPEEVKHYSSQIHDDMVFGIKKMDEIEDAYYFNHSCDPNAGYGGQIFLRTMRRIKKDEEVTFDYAMELSSSKIPNPKGKERFDKMECDCGAKNCRKIIGDDDWKNPELQKKYDGYFSWFIQDKICKNNK